jgi:hypothetical protein
MDHSNDTDGIGAKSQSFEGMMQNLVVDGKKYSPDVFAANDVARGLHADTSLNPGFSDDVVAAFDVPTNTLPATNEAGLDIQTDMMSPDVFVKIDGTLQVTAG